MIKALIKVIVELFPLNINNASFDGDTLTLSGESWNFSTLSAWRVLNGNEIEFACWDKNIEEQVSALNGLSIVGTQTQGAIVGTDPVFELSDGRYIEIFSTDTDEPWVMTLPSDTVFVGGTK